MPSFDYQKKIIFIKKIKKNCMAQLFKMLKLRVLDLFFHWNKCFCYYTEYSTEKRYRWVPVPNFRYWYRYQFKCERYPTLLVICTMSGFVLETGLL